MVMNTVGGDPPEKRPFSEGDKITYVCSGGSALRVLERDGRFYLSSRDNDPLPGDEQFPELLKPPAPWPPVVNGAVTFVWLSLITFPGNGFAVPAEHTLMLEHVTEFTEVEPIPRGADGTAHTEA